MSSLPLLMPLDRALAQRLRHVAAERGAREPACLELFRELGRRAARAHEDQHRIELFDLEDARQRLELVEAADLDEALVDRRDGRRLGLDLDLDRVRQMVLDDPPDAIGHRRGEQRDLLLLAACACRMSSTSSMKPMRSISSASSRTTRLESPELERLAAQVVLDAARRADDDVHAAAQLLQLEVHALPAVDRQHVEALQVPRVASASPRPPGSRARASA